MNTINTDDISIKYRANAIDTVNRKLSITNYTGSEQEKDLVNRVNCNGYGRIRHFKLSPGVDWPRNPLPIIPAVKYLGIQETDVLNAQVFQNSICNWRCWYCYVDFKLLNGDKRFSDFLSCEELINMYLQQNDPPKLIDLSGGQPDLTPEWVPWMMDVLKQRNLHDKVLLWSDDNLSNDYFWKYLTPDQIDLITNYQMYARVCCFKGVDQVSFSINTKADPNLFYRQFELFGRLRSIKIDLYAYITLTAPSNTNFETCIPVFLDRIQKIDENFPLRIVPLKIFEFAPTKSRNDIDKADLLHGQDKAILIWQKEMNKRFTPEMMSSPITQNY